MNRAQRRRYVKTLDMDDRLTLLNFVRALRYPKADGGYGKIEEFKLSSGKFIKIEEASLGQLQLFVREQITRGHKG